MERRKEKILFAVVEEYIHSARPVGSKSVVQSGIAASPATVRSEMSALAEMGLLEQPHTSAGRVPTDLGFRRYADYVLQESRLHPEDFKELSELRGRENAGAQELAAQTARVLSNLSRIVSMVTLAPAERAPLRSVHFLEQGRSRIRAVFQMMGGGQEEVVIGNDWGLDGPALQRLTNLVNKVAPGRTLIGLRRELIRQLEEARAQADILLARAVEISERIAAAGEPELFISGQVNLFDQPEFAEVGLLKEVARALSEKTVLVKMLEGVTLAGGFRVIIGGENAIGPMKRCSVIAGAYGRQGTAAGTLGVIGPTRMDYARLIPLIHHASELLSEWLSRREFQ